MDSTRPRPCTRVSYWSEVRVPVALATWAIWLMLLPMRAISGRIFAGSVITCVVWTLPCMSISRANFM